MSYCRMYKLKVYKFIKYILKFKNNLLDMS